MTDEFQPRIPARYHVQPVGEQGMKGAFLDLFFLNLKRLLFGQPAGMFFSISVKLQSRSPLWYRKFFIMLKLTFYTERVYYNITVLKIPAMDIGRYFRHILQSNTKPALPGAVKQEFN
jgi:hypothetical protein